MKNTITSPERLLEWKVNSLHLNVRSLPRTNFSIEQIRKLIFEQGIAFVNSEVEVKAMVVNMPWVHPDYKVKF